MEAAILSAVAVAAAVGAIVSALYVVKRVTATSAALAARVSAVPSGEALPSALPTVVLPDYIDEASLQSIAAQKGIAAETRTLISQRSLSSSSGATAEAQASLGAGVRVQATTRTTVTEAEDWSDAVSLVQTTGMRDALEVIYARLRADGELREDLAAIPRSVMADAAVTFGLANVTSRWGLEGVRDPAFQLAVRQRRGEGGAEDEDGPETDESADVTLAAAIFRVILEAFDRVEEAKRQELDDLRSRTVPATLFARVMTFWGAGESETDGVVLTNLWLLEDPERPRGATVIAKGLLEVPVDAAHVTALGRQRLVPGTEVWAEVFGTVDATRDPIRIVPFLIFSP